MFQHPVRCSSCPPAALALLGIVAAGGCTTPMAGYQPESTEFRTSVERVEEVQPADIAVAPIRNQCGRDDLPADLFREAFAQELVNRLYSPLGLAYVDANWVDSSFGGAPQPDALLVVAITDWNPDHMLSNGIVEVAADLYLFEGGSTTGNPLWGVTVTRQIDLGDGRGNPPTPAAHLRPKAVRLFVEEALAGLPERDPLAANGGS